MRKRRDAIPAGKVERGERKRTAVEVYAFDAWMARTFPHIPFERYADDIICHCNSAEEARAVWGAIADRFTVCKLVLHPQKTKIVYCKDANRQDDFPNIHFDFLGFQFRAWKIRWVKADRRIFAHSFQPAASDSRGSCTVLGARGGEIPLRDSTKAIIFQSMHLPSASAENFAHIAR